MVERWFGIHKVKEEVAELLVELAKLEAYPNGRHPDEVDKGPLTVRIENEMGDLYAALDYFSRNVDEDRIRKRRLAKGIRFRRWQLRGIEAPDNDEPVAECTALVFAMPDGSEPCGRRMPCPDHPEGCQGYRCPTDGDCPEHGKNRSGQCVPLCPACHGDRSRSCSFCGRVPA